MTPLTTFRKKNVSIQITCQIGIYQGRGYFSFREKKSNQKKSNTENYYIFLVFKFFEGFLGEAVF